MAMLLRTTVGAVKGMTGCCVVTGEGEREIVFRSRYIVLGLVVGGSGENESGIDFNLQITVKYLDKLF